MARSGHVRLDFTNRLVNTSADFYCPHHQYYKREEKPTLTISRY